MSSLENYRKIGVRLYYYILKLHQVKFPPDLRNLGNKYVKSEFEAHKKASEDQYKQFLDAWIEYYRKVSQTTDLKNLGKDIDPEDWAYFSDEQKDSLNKLKEYTKNKKQ